MMLQAPIFPFRSPGVRTFDQCLFAWRETEAAPPLEPREALPLHRRQSAVGVLKIPAALPHIVAA